MGGWKEWYSMMLTVKYLGSGFGAGVKA